MKRAATLVLILATACSHTLTPAQRKTEFCARSMRLRDAQRAFKNVDTHDPAALRDAIGLLLHRAEDARAFVADDVKAPFDVIVDSIKAFVDSLTKVGYDIGRLTANQTFQTPDVQEASKLVGSYTTLLCGFAATS